ncbi:Squalene/phytoene synthase-domain-containing protein [Morchella snyderi]|nr:Squalene/phytoene synthase-domain-containing protein [Morchella snyderi]
MRAGLLRPLLRAKPPSAPLPAAARLPHLQKRTHTTTTTTTAARPPPSVDSARAYCATLLQNHDYASHLTTHLLHPHVRDAHLAIRAFNIDTALIDDAVSSAAVGRLRMQYWRDALDATYAGRAPAEPVAVLLASVLRAGVPLGKGWFRRVVGCRRLGRNTAAAAGGHKQEQYLGAVPFATLGDLEAYAEGTYASLNYLGLEAFGVRSVALDHVASHLGKAAGIAAVLRGMPLLAFPPGGGGGGGGAVVFPLDVCVQQGLRQEDVLRRGGGAAGLRDAVFAVATRANDHLITARKMLAEAGAEGRGAVFGAFLGAVPTALYLEQLEAADFDPFEAGLQRRPWKLPYRAYRAYTTRKF